MGLEEIEVERLGDGESGLQAGEEREIGGVCVRGENGENRVCELDARGKEGSRMEGGGFGIEEAIVRKVQKVRSRQKRQERKDRGDARGPVKV